MRQARLVSHLAVWVQVLIVLLLLSLSSLNAGLTLGLMSLDTTELQVRVPAEARLT